jgi:Methyltransferase domain
MDNDLRGQDPSSYGHSLANLAEIVLPILDAARARSVIEIGSYTGDLTRELLEWAAGSGARITAIEPKPPPALLDLHREHPELELVAEVSHDALRRQPGADAVIIDGDHNYYTLSEELRLIEERAPEAGLPLLMFHDVGWPNARRDSYYAPDRIPEGHRQPVVRGASLFPGERGVVEAGLQQWWTAEHEGGPRNGVLTAVEDFVESREGLRLAIVPLFWGLGILWRTDAPWADAVAEIVEPWDRNPILQRVEANRVLHLARTQVEIARGNARNARQEHLLRTMLASSAFAWGERLSRLRKRGKPMFSRRQVREVLGEDEPD